MRKHVLIQPNQHICACNISKLANCHIVKLTHLHITTFQLPTDYHATHIPTQSGSAPDALRYTPRAFLRSWAN